jgi:hypothetical protein
MPSLPPLSKQPGGVTLESGAFTWQLLPGCQERHPSQKSARQKLIADTRYYLEVLHDYATNDFVMVTWSKLGESNQASTNVVGGPELSAYFEANSPNPRKPNR